MLSIVDVNNKQSIIRVEDFFWSQTEDCNLGNSFSVAVRGISKEVKEGPGYMIFFFLVGKYMQSSIHLCKR